MNDDWEEVDPAQAKRSRTAPSMPAPQRDSEVPIDALSLPAGAGIIQSLVGQLPYWGMARTIKACRKMVQEKTGLVTDTTELGKALLEQEKQKALWENRDDIIKAVKVSVLGKLDRAYAEGNEAKAALVESETNLGLVRLRQKALEIIAETEDENRQAALYEAKYKSKMAQNRYEERLDGSDSESRRMIQQLSEMKRNYEALMKEKAADVAKYGSEEKMPSFLRAAYEQLEDKLSFSKG